MDQSAALLSKAQKYLRSAAVLLELEDFDSCASRSYFAMFYAAQAALLRRGGDLPSRQGIRTAFVERFVEGGPLPQRAADALARAADLQERGDFGHDFAVGRADAEDVLQSSEAFVNGIERLLEGEAQDA